MGMFDYVQCDRLVQGEPEAFQTKDLDCDLNMVKITNDGRLVTVSRQVWFENRKEVDYLKVYEDLNYNGIIEFYGDIDGKYEEYRAQFLNGQLVGLWKSHVFRELYTYYGWERKQQYVEDRKAFQALPKEEQERRREETKKMLSNFASMFLSSMNHTGFMRKFLSK